MADRPLHGVGVLVTRPRTQANELVSAIEAQGGHAICFPVIEIAPFDTNIVDKAVAALERAGPVPTRERLIAAIELRGLSRLPTLRNTPSPLQGASISTASNASGPNVFAPSVVTMPAFAQGDE